MTSGPAPANPVPAIFSKTGTTYLEAKPHGIEFAFPDAGNMAAHINRILRGVEYPIPELPGFAPRLIVDIGANVGASAVFFALRYPGAAVHCYEPSTHNIAFIARNIAALPHITCHPYGLNDREQTLDLFLGFSQSMTCSVVASAETGQETERVTLRRARPELEQIGLAGGGTILKLDTEGCEVPILRDIADLLDGVALLYVEYHSEADRRTIDDLLAGRFMLAAARATVPHRGLNLYVAETLALAYPMLHAYRVAPPA
jgi:FkbM family methyltransferase